MIWIVIAVPVFILLVLAFIYNGLVFRRNRVDQAFSSIDVYLKQRYDLIPNLVAAVKGYMDHEEAVFTEIAELRSKAMKAAPGSDEVIDLNNMLGRALTGLYGVIENYPELKASDNVMHLQRSLNEIEEKISASRRAFNAAITDYNNSCEMFPSSIVAGMTGHRSRRFFAIEESERVNPDASLR